MGNKNKKQYRNNNKTQIQSFEENVMSEIHWEKYSTVMTVDSPVKDNKKKPEAKPSDVKYVVVRDGIRVSDSEYNNPEDPLAIAEQQFWERVAKNHSTGEPVQIVIYDSKKHKVW